jgi:hypothetical protein
MQPSTLPNLTGCEVSDQAPPAAFCSSPSTFFGRAINLQLGIPDGPAEDLFQAADDLFGHADDSVFVHVTWCFALLSVVKALAADAGPLHRPG